MYEGTDTFDMYKEFDRDPIFIPHEESKKNEEVKNPYDGPLISNGVMNHTFGEEVADKFSPMKKAIHS